MWDARGEFYVITDSIGNMLDPDRMHPIQRGRGWCWVVYGGDQRQQHILLPERGGDGRWSTMTMMTMITIVAEDDNHRSQYRLTTTLTDIV